jgi:HAD superfamily hydrolase (TIGR01509 family)
VGFIFDMGNVLSLDVDVMPCVASVLGMSIREINDYAGDDFTAMLVGTKTAEEFWRGFNRHFGTDVREDLLAACFHPENDPRMERLILALKAAGHRVVCGTNALETHYRHHLSRGEYASFDHVYASNLLGIAKPSPAFYRHILEQEGWQAQDTFFVDDRAANVEAARELGMLAFQYHAPESFASLVEWLIDRQVLPESFARERGGRSPGGPREEP